jgi:hypothetical protein
LSQALDGALSVHAGVILQAARAVQANAPSASAQDGVWASLQIRAAREVAVKNALSKAMKK